MRWECEDSQIVRWVYHGASFHVPSMRWECEDSQIAWMNEHREQLWAPSMRWECEDSQIRSQHLLPLTWCFALACERHVRRLS